MGCVLSVRRTLVSLASLGTLRKTCGFSIVPGSPRLGTMEKPQVSSIVPKLANVANVHSPAENRELWNLPLVGPRDGAVHPPLRVAPPPPPLALIASPVARPHHVLPQAVPGGVDVVLREPARLGGVEDFLGR